MKWIGTILILTFNISLSFTQGIFSLQESGEAPSRTYDVLHYRIEVSLDQQKKTVTGKVTTTLIPLAPGFRTLVFNAAKMQIKRVTIGAKDMLFTLEANALSIQLDRLYSLDDTLKASVEYSCTPRKGMTFNGPDSAYPAKRWQIWSQGQDTTNHFWFPCYDFPNDKATSEVIATVNSKFVVLSNGRLVSVKEDKKKGTKTFHWKQGKPHVPYLIMVAAGEYTILRDNAGKIPLEFYAYPDDTLNARITFKETATMIKFFNEKIGFAYPWEKYGQIILQGHFGGMENTGATTLSDLWAVPDARARLDDSPSSLIAHELAHQWWGDVVTCKDWRHVWLNESFASYFDPLYHERSLGRDEFDYRMYGSQQSGITIDTTRGRKPIVSVDSYRENVYPRGASVLHMLRFLLGDELFWKAINHYITKYQFQSIETNDFKVAIEEATGQNLYWFFDQWVYKAGHPIFNVSYRWSDSVKAIFLSVKQVQATDSLTGIFRMPVDVEVSSSAGIVTRRVNILAKDTTFTLPSPAKPRLVIFDKGNWLLKEIQFEKSPEEWRYQAKSATNPIDRIQALQQLVKLPKNVEYIPVLADRMLRDAFWAVRREAVWQLGKIETDKDSLKDQLKRALFAAYMDSRSTVREAAVSALSKFKENDVVELLHAALRDSSYAVMASALRSLAKADSARALTVLKQYLNYPSHYDRVAGAALNAVASVDSLEGIKLALERARYGQPVRMRHAALGILGRYGKERADIVTFYESLLSDKNDRIRSNAARTLGDIGGEVQMSALEKIASDAENPASEVAQESIEKIRKRIAEKVKQGSH